MTRQDQKQLFESLYRFAHNAQEVASKRASAFSYFNRHGSYPRMLQSYKRFRAFHALANRILNAAWDRGISPFDR